MTIIEQEIMTQHLALQQTTDWFEEHGDSLKQFLRSRPFRQLVFIGCGSSYMLACAGARLFALRTPIKAEAIPGGDYLLNPKAYQNLLDEALTVVITRSGRTSEIDLAVDEIRRSSSARILCLHAKSGTPVPLKSDFEIPLNWAHDESVCQTRTVSCFYLALAALTAIWNDDKDLMRQLREVSQDNDAFKLENRQALETFARWNWNQGVILADAECADLAREGALAFQEICLKRGASYSLLDFRHGPAVLADGQTLAILVIGRGKLELQLDLVNDLKARGVRVACLSSMPCVPGADLTIQTRDYPDFAVWGIPMIYMVQMTAFTRAVFDHHDPDRPTGLDPYITLINRP